MVDSVTGRGPFKINSGAEGEFIFRFRKGAKLVPTNEPLNFTKTFHPGAVDHWFDAAKAAHEKDWIDGVKKIAGGDSNG